MRKSLFLITLLTLSFQVFAKDTTRGMQIESKIEDDSVHVIVYNGNLFAKVCTGTLYVETETGNILTAPIARMIIRGGKYEVASFKSSSVLKGAHSQLNCY